MTPFEYWSSGAGLSHITPPGQLWPEGKGFPAFLTGLVGAGSVLEIGCGIGRLAALFSPRKYIGVDICASAIEQARAILPDHRFLIVDEQEALPAAEVTLLYTVLLHVSDDDLPEIIARVKSPRVMVGEILGRRWRRPGLPPVFNREAEDYERAFGPRYVLSGHLRHPYHRYGGTEVSFLEFEQ